MPELSASRLAIAALILLVAAASGWLLRSRRAAREKAAINASWQQQLDAQQKENDRIAAQSRHLREQIGHLQQSNVRARDRAEALADQLEEAVASRDQLMSRLATAEGEAKRALAQRERLRSDVESKALRRDAAYSQLREKDDKIARLKVELARWQERVPPLVERYRRRDQEALALEAELDLARRRIAEQERRSGSDDTRIEPVDNAAIDGMDASNDQYEDTLEVETAAAATPDAGRDDLKRIKGIGPAIEKTLNRLGIFRLEQIAGFSGEDVERVGTELPGFGSRIRREDWIGQARSLLADAGADPA